MVIDSFQKIFVMNVQLRQCFSGAKSFRLKKARFCLAFFDSQKKPKVFKKSQKFKIWLQISQIGTPVLNHYNQALQQEQCTFVKQIMTT